MKTIIFTFIFIFLANVGVAQYIISITKTDGSEPIEFQASLINQIAFYPTCPGLPTVDYSDKIYNTVQIGSQCWLKENLDVGTMMTGGDPQTDNSTIEKYCYNNDPGNCDIYGGLYQWNEAVQYADPPEDAQGICPPGWHIPSEAEYYALRVAVNYDGDALKAVGQGTGTNTSGFSALLGGGHISGSFSELGNYAFIWSSGQALYIYSSTSTVAIFDYNKTYAFSVRCIKD